MPAPAGRQCQSSAVRSSATALAILTMICNLILSKKCPFVSFHDAGGSESRLQHCITSMWLFKSLWKVTTTRLSAPMVRASYRWGNSTHSWQRGQEALLWWRAVKWAVKTLSKIQILCFCHEFMSLPVWVVLIPKYSHQNKFAFSCHLVVTHSVCRGLKQILCNKSGQIKSIHGWFYQAAPMT